jgi:hypothetical protein
MEHPGSNLLHRAKSLRAAILCGCLGLLNTSSEYLSQLNLHRLRPSRNSDEEEHLKKIELSTLLILATLLFTLAFTAAAAGPNSPATPVPAAAAVPAAPAAAPPAPHPHIHEALESMRAAKHHLESAVPEFHGHRAKAIEHLDQAIHEAEICEQEP